MQPWLLLLSLSAVFGLTGCKKHPEDEYVGREQWLNTRSDKGTIYYSYDLGSVRRAGQTVIVKASLIDDIDFELSGTNMKRQSDGLPLYLGASGLLIIDCEKRTYRGQSVTGEFQGGERLSVPDSKSRLIAPNSAIEEIFDHLCV